MQVEANKIDTTLPYERRFWPGFIIRDTHWYQVVKYTNDVKPDDSVLCAKMSWVMFPILDQKYYWVLEKIDPPKPEFEIKTCTRIWDCNRKKYVTVDPFEVRVYNKRPQPNEYGFVQLDNNTYAALQDNNIGPLPWKRCEFVSGNPLETDEYKFEKYYVNKYKVGQIITHGNKKYQILAFDEPQSDETVILGEFTKDAITSLMRCDYPDIIGKFGRKRYIVGRVDLDYETDFEIGRVVTKGNKKWKITAYRVPLEYEEYIGVFSTKDMVEIVQNLFKVDEPRWIVEPVWSQTEEEIAKRYWREATPDALIQALGNKENFNPSGAYYQWLVDVVKERLK